MLTRYIRSSFATNTTTTTSTTTTRRRRRESLFGVGLAGDSENSETIPTVSIYHTKVTESGDKESQFSNTRLGFEIF